MRLFPWRERAHHAACEAEAARCHKEAVKAQRPFIRAIAEELRRHDEANGWTDAVSKIWGAPS